MRSIWKISLALLLFCCSCKKVIDVTLKEGDARYVVEGIITDEPGVCKVYLSKTKAFDEDNQFESVSGALVKVVDNGIAIQLPETRPGVYETSSINGTPGHTYQLSVSINSQLFSASCTMPNKVLMDTLYISRGPLGQFKFATIGFKDPPGVRNFYRFVQYVNGAQEPTIFWRNDEFTDGDAVSLQLDASGDKKDDPRNIKTGDEVKVEMLCLDEAVFNFWYSLRVNGGDGTSNTAAPGNPETNIKGGALGYFSAHTIDRRVVIAP